MDFSSTKSPSVILFLSSLFIHATLGERVCEELPNHACAFSVSSSGRRCLLEATPGKDGSMDKHCRTSKVVVEKLADYIETDECVKACGVDRDAVGISSDAFLEPRFLQNMCTTDCYERCPNLVELYFKLAAGEGVFLPYLCERQRSEPHRDMRESPTSVAASGSASEQIEEVDGAMAPGPAPEQAEEVDGTMAPGPAPEQAEEVDSAIAPSPTPEQAEEVYDTVAPSPGSEQVEEVDAMAPAPASEQVGEEEDYAMAPSPASEQEEEEDYAMAPAPVSRKLFEAFGYALF